MGDFNKVVSFFLGLIVVVVFLAVVTGRLNLRQRVLSNNVKRVVTPTPTTKAEKKSGGFLFFRRATPTPTPTPHRITPTIRQQPTAITNYKTGNQIVIATPTKTQPITYITPQPTSTNSSSEIATIPSTGADTALIPFALSSLAAGLYLSKIKK